MVNIKKSNIVSGKLHALKHLDVIMKSGYFLVCLAFYKNEVSCQENFWDFEKACIHHHLWYVFWQSDLPHSTPEIRSFAIN